MVIDTFTAANTSKGFYSLFDKLLYEEGLKKVYLIKGGPGCGKSSFMKKVADKFEKDNLTVERIHCSSDFESLDGVKIEETGVAIIDATSPHAYDMKYPGAYESLIDFSRFWDEKKLAHNLTEICELCEDISSKYKTVYSLLRAVWAVESWKSSLIDQYADNEKITAQIKKIIKQNAISQEDGIPKTTHRMLSAYSGSGIKTFSDTIYSLCDEIIVFDDTINISYIAISRIAALFTKLGYDTVQIHCPLAPESRLEGVLVPSLGLGAVSKGHPYSPYIDEGKIIKTINTKSFIDRSVYTQNKNKLSFSRKFGSEMIGKVCEQLSDIKALHDDLEQYYISATDFEKVNEFTEDFIRQMR